VHVDKWRVFVACLTESTRCFPMRCPCRKVDAKNRKCRKAAERGSEEGRGERGRRGRKRKEQGRRGRREAEGGTAEGGTERGKVAEGGREEGHRHQGGSEERIPFLGFLVFLKTALLGNPGTSKAYFFEDPGPCRLPVGAQMRPGWQLATPKVVPTWQNGKTCDFFGTLKIACVSETRRFKPAKTTSCSRVTPICNLFLTGGSVTVLQ